MSNIYLQLKQPAYRYAIGGIAVFMTIVLILSVRASSGINVKGLFSHVPGASTRDILDDIYNSTLGVRLRTIYSQLP